jgi:NAD(P)H dehydrogenase (quinone)
MILVTGANGTFGRLVVEHLLSAVPADTLAVSVRDPARAAELAARGVAVRQADFDAPETVARAFAGAHTVLVNATNYGTGPAQRRVQHAAAISAAQAAGAKRLVVTSFQDLARCSMPAVAGYAETEAQARSAGLAATVLRLTAGLDTATARDVRWAMAAGALIAPAGRARIAPPALADLAEAAANVAHEPGHEDTTYELTGPDAVSWDDLAALAGSLAGRDLEYRPVPDDEYREHVATLGFPADAVGPLLDYYAAVRAGWASTPHGDLGRLLHRPPVPALEAVRRASAS